MSTSLLRGLRLLELLAEEPRRQADLARILGVDHAGVSRTLAALLAEGWVVRLGGKYQLGARAQVFAAGPDERAFVDRADRLVRLLSGLTGVAASAFRLSGDGLQAVAMSVPDRFAPLAEAQEPYRHLAGTAAGVAVLAQLDDDRVAALTDPSEVRFPLSAVRGGAAVRESGWSYPGAACLALPWPDGAPWAPTALVLIGFETDFDDSWDQFEAVLRAAVAPGAGPVDVVEAAGRARALV